MEPVCQKPSPGAGTANGTLVSTCTLWPRWRSHSQTWAHITLYPLIDQGGYSRLITSTRREGFLRRCTFHAGGAISFVIHCQAETPRNPTEVNRCSAAALSCCVSRKTLVAPRSCNRRIPVSSSARPRPSFL